MAIPKAYKRMHIPGVAARRTASEGDIEVNPARHLGVYAPPRAGKTTLLRGLALDLPRGNDCVVVDTAQRGDWTGVFPTTADPDALGDPDAYPKVVWQPDLDAVRNPSKDLSDPWSRGWWYLWNVRGELDESGQPVAGSTLVIDEPADGVLAKVIPDIHRAVVQGEGRRLAIWWGSQNVLTVYWRLRANTQQRFASPLPTAQDRGILAADWGVEIPLADESTEWGTFFFHSPGKPLIGPSSIRQLLPGPAGRRTLEIAEAQRLQGR